MSYCPKLNDYVKWTKDVEGWVYYLDKDGEYITIESMVRPKDDVNYSHCSLHRNERLLIICYRKQWKELEFIKSRKTIYENDRKSAKFNEFYLECTP